MSENTTLPQRCSSATSFGVVNWKFWALSSLPFDGTSSARPSSGRPSRRSTRPSVLDRDLVARRSSPSTFSIQVANDVPLGLFDLVDRCRSPVVEVAAVASRSRCRRPHGGLLVAAALRCCPRSRCCASATRTRGHRSRRTPSSRRARPAASCSGSARLRTTGSRCRTPSGCRRCSTTSSPIGNRRAAGTAGSNLLTPLPCVEVDAAGAAAGRDLGVGDAHLADEALERVGAAGRDRDLRHVDAHRVRRHVVIDFGKRRVRGAERVVGALRDRRDLDRCGATCRSTITSGMFAPLGTPVSVNVPASFGDVAARSDRREACPAHCEHTRAVGKSATALERDVDRDAVERQRAVRREDLAGDRRRRHAHVLRTSTTSHCEAVARAVALAPTVGRAVIAVAALAAAGVHCASQ